MFISSEEFGTEQIQVSVSVSPNEGVAIVSPSLREVYDVLLATRPTKGRRAFIYPVLEKKAQPMGLSREQTLFWLSWVRVFSCTKPGQMDSNDLEKCNYQTPMGVSVG